MPVYGDDTVETPAISEMASSGVAFTNVFSPNPICSPTRSALITGGHPAEIDVNNHRSSRDERGRDDVFLPEEWATLPELMQRAGYETFNIGKDDYNFVYDRRDLYSLGPDGVEGHIGALDGPDFDWPEAVGSKPFFGQIQLEGDKHKGTARRTISPESVTVPPYYPETEEFRSHIARHYETIEITDGEVGAILEKLKSAGLADNTIVFVFADHGMRMLRHKQFLYDGGVHVPLVISGAVDKERLSTLRTRSNDLISLVDVAATTLSMAGGNIPEYFYSEDLSSADYVERDHLILARDRADYTFDYIRGVRTDRFKYLRNYYPDRPYLQAQYRDNWPAMKEWKEMFATGDLTREQALFMQPVRPMEELYDLRNDPHEVHNLAADPEYADELKRLRSILDAWAAAGKDNSSVPPDTEEVQSIIDRWGERCVSPECISVRKMKQDQN
nr:hypothetical protein GCM10011355_01110 [Aquisalinus luteolus]